MPLYEYQCAECGRFELIQKFSDAPLAQCPTCGGDVHKLLSAPAIQFKGTGWYITDYARSGSGEKKAGTADGAGKDGGSKDAAKPEAGGASKGGGSSKSDPA